MISHKYKIIFIHIPRTGGTSIEIALTGEDWMDNKPNEKHLTASQAKKLYGEETWNNYFKISFVRNPWDRLISLWLHSNVSKGLPLNEFILKYEPAQHEPPSPFYSDILDLELDFIGRYENLQKDFNRICRKLKIHKIKLPHAKKTPGKITHYSQYYDRGMRELVAKLYEKDIKKFNYNFEYNIFGNFANEIKNIIRTAASKILPRQIKHVIKN